MSDLRVSGAQDLRHVAGGLDALHPVRLDLVPGPFQLIRPERLAGHALQLVPDGRLQPLERHALPRICDDAELAGLAVGAEVGIDVCRRAFLEVTENQVGVDRTA